MKNINKNNVVCVCVEVVGLPNPCVINLNGGDVGDFGPKLWILHLTSFAQQRASPDDVELY